VGFFSETGFSEFFMNFLQIILDSDTIKGWLYRFIRVNYQTLVQVNYLKNKKLTFRSENILKNYPNKRFEKLLK